MPYADPAKRLANQRIYSAQNRTKINEAARAWKRANPEAVRAHSRKAYAANPEKFKARHKVYVTKHKPWRREANKAKQREWLYGMSNGEFDAMLSAQQSACAGCGTTIAGSSAHVDHCHETKRVRGLLCRKCNLALGHTNDDPEILRRLAAYLEKENTHDTGH